MLLPAVEVTLQSDSFGDDLSPKFKWHCRLMVGADIPARDEVP